MCPPYVIGLVRTSSGSVKDPLANLRDARRNADNDKHGKDRHDKAPDAKSLHVIPLSFMSRVTGADI